MSTMLTQTPCGSRDVPVVAMQHPGLFSSVEVDLEATLQRQPPGIANRELGCATVHSYGHALANKKISKIQSIINQATCRLKFAEANRHPWPSHVACELCLHELEPPQAWQQQPRRLKAPDCSAKQHGDPRHHP